MPIDPTDPNNPQQNTPNQQPVDLNKLFNFEEVRRNIDHFFQELVDKVQPVAEKLFADISKESKEAFKDVSKHGMDAFKEIAKESSNTFGVFSKEAGEAGKTGSRKYKNIWEASLSELEEQIKETFTAADWEESAENLKKSNKAVADAEMREDKKLLDARMKYIKMITSKEEIAVQEIIKDRMSILDSIDAEYIEKKDKIKKEITDEQEKQRALIKLDQERERKKTDFTKLSVKKEKEARGEFGANLSKTLSMTGIGSRAKGDLTATLLATAEKFSSVAFLLGGVAGVLMKVFAVGQDLLIRQAKQSQMSFNVSGKLNTGLAERAFANVEPFLKTLGMEQEDIQKYLGVLGEAPNVLKEIANKGDFSLKKLTNRLGMMGMTADETAQLVAKASLDWGMSIEDLLDIQQKSSALQKITGMRASDAMNAFINLNSQLRRISSNTRDAATLMALTGRRPSEFSQTEQLQFQGKLADIISSFKPSDIASMFAMVNKRLPAEGEANNLRTTGGTTKLFFDSLIAKLGDTLFNKQDNVAALALENLVPNLGGKELPQLLEKLRDYAKAASPQKAIDDLIKDQESTAKELAEQEKAGRETMQKSVSVGQHLNSALDSLLTAIIGQSGLTNGIWALVRMIDKIPGMRQYTPEAQMQQSSALYDTRQLQRAMKSGTRKNLPKRSYTATQVANYDPVTGKIEGGKTMVRFRNTSQQTLSDDSWKNF